LRRFSIPIRRQPTPRRVSNGQTGDHFWWRLGAILAVGSLAVLPLRSGLAHDEEARPAAASPQSCKKQAAGRYRMSDCHLHLVDFLQRTEGIKAVIDAMDRSGVDHALISGMPFVKKWEGVEPIKPEYYLEDDGRCYWYSATDVLVGRAVESLPRKDRGRLHPFICGFNATDRNAVDHIRRMIEWFPGLWKGIGEVMGRHDDLTALTYGEPGRANHIALDPVYELAAEYDLPVSIHNNISSVWKRDPIYLKEMEEALSRHPKTRFIWCHAGVSRRVVVPTLPQELRRMLATYPNLYIDLSWVLFEDYLVKEHRPVQEWVSLIESFPTRFMIGSDKVGKFGNYPDEMLKFNTLLDALQPETARKVARDNFLLVLPKEGATLKEKR
jgi:predicted TIM-barrel fold metal-dependent hydrolase